MRMSLFHSQNLGSEHPLKVLLIGGAGFIGSHLCHRMTQHEGWLVTVIDRFDNYNQLDHESFEQETKYLEKLRSHVEFELIADICKLDIRAFSKQYGQYDLVVHLASNPLAKLCEADHLLADTEVSNPCLAALDLCKQIHAKKIIYISSSMVYGHFSVDPISEDEILKPINFYGKAKRQCEKQVQNYCSSNQIDWSIIRPSAVYGPGDRNNRILYRIIRSFLGIETAILGNLDEALDFTYVEDLVQGICQVAKSPLTKTVFNLTYGNKRTLREAVEFIRNRFIELSFAADMEEDQFYLLKSRKVLTSSNPKRGTLSIEKARRLVGYQPQFSLEEGLKLTIQFLFDREMSNYKFRKMTEQNENPFFRHI